MNRSPQKVRQNSKLHWLPVMFKRTHRRPCPKGLCPAGDPRSGPSPGYFSSLLSLWPTGAPHRWDISIAQEGGSIYWVAVKKNQRWCQQARIQPQQCLWCKRQRSAARFSEPAFSPRHNHPVKEEPLADPMMGAVVTQVTAEVVAPVVMHWLAVISALSLIKTSMKSWNHSCGAIKKISLEITRRPWSTSVTLTSLCRPF